MIQNNKTPPIRILFLFFQLILAIVPIAFVMFALMFQPGLLTGLTGNGFTVGSSNDNHILITNSLDGSPRILFYDSSGNNPMGIELTPTGTPMIHMDSPKTGNRAIEISTALKGGRPHIMLFNPTTGSPAWSIQIDPDGKPLMTDFTIIDN